MQAIFRQWRWWLALAATLAVFGYSYWVNYMRDEPPPNDADLRAWRLSIADSENGLVQLAMFPPEAYNFSSFAELHGVTDSQEQDEIVLGLRRNDALVAAFLSDNEVNFRRLDEVLLLPYFQAGEETSLNQDDIPLRNILRISRAARLAAFHQRNLGDYSAVIRELQRLNSLVSRLARDPTSVVIKECAMVGDSFAMDIGVDLLNDPTLPADIRDQLKALFGNETDWQAALNSALPVDYVWIDTLLDHSSREPAAAPEGRGVIGEISSVSAAFKNRKAWLELRPNALCRRMGDLIRLQQKLPWDTYGEYIGAWQASIADYYAKPANQIVIGSDAQELVQMLQEGVPFGVGRWAFALRARHRLLQTGFALRAYYDEHGVLPVALSALEPKYLPSIPLDPFDGRPVRYDAAKGIVFSVGTQLVDLGGSKRVGTPRTDPDYEDPFFDLEQPTLELDFSKTAAIIPVPVGTTPASPVP